MAKNPLRLKLIGPSVRTEPQAREKEVSLKYRSNIGQGNPEAKAPIKRASGTSTYAEA